MGESTSLALDILKLLSWVTVIILLLFTLRNQRRMRVDKKESVRIMFIRVKKMCAALNNNVSTEIHSKAVYFYGLWERGVIPDDSMLNELLKMSAILRLEGVVEQFFEE